MIHENTKAPGLIRKSFMAVILSITVVFMMMPAIAFADDTVQEYGLWVGGVQVTSENCDNILDATDEKTGLPTASYDPQTGTLELHDPEITGTYTFQAIRGAIVSTIPLTIVGTAKIETTAGDALYVTGSDNTVDGTAPLTFDNGDGFETDLEFIGNTCGISAYGNDITIKGGKVSCSGTYGLYRRLFEGNLNIEGGELICKGSSYGIYLYHNNLNITGGKLTAECIGNISEQDRYPLFIYENYGSIKMGDAPCGTITEPANGHVVTDSAVGSWIVNPDNTKAAKVVIAGDHSWGEPTVIEHPTADSPGRTGKTCAFCSATSEDNLYMVVTDEEIENGKVSADVEEAVAGDTVQLNAEPEQYFRLKAWNVTDKSGQPVAVDTDDKFTMPKANVFVSAEFEYIPVTTLRWKASPQTFWLNEGDIDNKKLEVSVNPSDACHDLIWTSSNEDVATVATDGTITAIKEGTTTITVTSAIDSTKSLSATLTVKHVHDPSYIAASQPSCTGEGNIEYWICNQGPYACGKLFADAECTQEIKIEDTVIEPLGHDVSEWETTKEATCTEDGEKKGTCSRCGESVTEAIPAPGHEWGERTVTKQPTETAAGSEIRECSVCHKTETRAVPAMGYAPGADPNQKGSDGTAVGTGASAAAAEKAITSMKKDADPKGTAFSKLRLKSTKQTKKSVKLSWTKVSKAKKYVIYGNKCGKANKPKKLATVTGNTKNFSKVAGKKVKKGTYYKFIMVALDKNNNVISTSRLIHVATKGGKVGNHKSVTVKKSVLKKAKKLKKGKSLSLKAKAVAQSKKLKVQKHVKIRYETTNKKIATVSTKGVVKGKKKGTCYVYAYAQNGVYKKIKVVVK